MDMPATSLVDSDELGRLRRRKTLRGAEIRLLQSREVLCASCGRRMPALRLLWAGYDECGSCNRIELLGEVEIGLARASGHAVLEY